MINIMTKKLVLRSVFAVSALLASSSLVRSQAFDYVHGGVGFRCEALAEDKAWFSFTGGVIRYTEEVAGELVLHNAAVPDNVRGTLRGIHMSRDAQGTYGYCVGDDGVVLFSADAGVTWTQKTVVVTSATHGTSPNIAPELWDCWFQDRLHGYVIGFDHTVQETVDGGQNWIDIAPAGHVSAGNPKWYQIHGFSNGDWITVANGGWVLRYDGNYHAQTIGQDLWCYLPEVASMPWDLEIYAVDFVGDIGVAVGGVGNNDGYIFRTEDRGETWSLDSPCFEYLNPSSSTKTPPTLYGVELFDDPDGGAVVGYSSFCLVGGASGLASAPDQCAVCNSVGKSWIQTVCDSDQNSVVDPYDDQSELFVRDVCASSSNQRSFLVGDFGTLRVSEDQGVTWAETNGLHRGRISCGAFSDPTVGIIGGQRYRVFSTVDGGENFSLDLAPAIQSGAGGDIQDVGIGSDGHRAIACGDRGRLYVRDSGGIWTDRSVGAWDVEPAFTSCLAIGNGQVMLAGGAIEKTQTFVGGTIQFTNKSVLYLSIDGGATAFVPLDLTFNGAAVSSRVEDIAFDGNYFYYLTANKRIYIASVLTSISNALVELTVPAGAATTCIGVRSHADFYVGDAAGGLYKFDLGSQSMVAVTGVTADQLGDRVFDCEPVPGTADWFFTGDLGQVVRLQGSTFSTPKSSIGTEVVGAEFFSATEGLLIGRKANLAVWK
ncbi:MAG: hypothetical protein AB8H80_05410 [Planctomycetota bacterium]